MARDRDGDIDDISDLNDISESLASDVNELIETVTLNQTHTEINFNNVTVSIAQLTEELRALRFEVVEARRENRAL